MIESERTPDGKAIRVITWFNTPAVRVEEVFTSPLDLAAFCRRLWYLAQATWPQSREES